MKSRAAGKTGKYGKDPCNENRPSVDVTVAIGHVASLAH
jgi:hypothetical protein